MKTDPFERRDADYTYTVLNDRHLNIYRFVLRYTNYIYSVHSYGNGIELTMIEAHTLSYIDDSPGTTPTELAKYWKLTKGAISQILTRLETMGLVEKRKEDGNRKTVHLYLTEKGRESSLNHKNFDILDIAKTMGELKESVTDEEIASFFKVLAAYNEVIEKDFELNAASIVRRGRSSAK